MDYINAFWVGGLICALVQILMEKTKMLPGRIMVFTRMPWGGAWRIADLSAIHRVRGSRCKCAAARLWKYTLERRKGSSGREWIYWHFYGGFKASAVGISAALIFSYIASIIFQPKMKK